MFKSTSAKEVEMVHAENASADLKVDTTSQQGDDNRVIVTPAESSRIVRRTDLYVLTILCWVYFLQILDKSVIGYSAVFGLKKNANLVGNQYAQVGTIGYYAQLGAQPLGALLLVKLKPRTLMTIVVTCWGISLCGMAASTNYHSLLATRFLLGFFEAACLPLFSLITASWYRRSEQPLRVAAWYSTNGVATILGSAMVYGLGHIKSDKLHSYQIIFLVFGLITVITGPTIWFFMSNSVEEAKFLTPEERVKGVERLRSNNTGIIETHFKMAQVVELFLDPKTWLFMCMTICVNVGASVSNVFGPLILQSLVGFDSFTTILLNIPFGALQLIMILGASYCAQRFRVKSAIFAGFMVPVVVGAALLYAVPHVKGKEGPLLLGYYLLSFLFAANPLIVSWMAANTAGQTKKASIFAFFNAASAAGNIVGPNLFKAKDSPEYLPGLKAVLAIFCILIGLVGLQVVYLRFLNARQSRRRVANGKPANIKDVSMTRQYEAQGDGLGKQAFEDLTDLKNDEFIYVY